VNMNMPKLPISFGKKERPVLGVDIGSHTVKVVEYSGNGQKRAVRRVGRALVPNGAIEDGSIKDHEAISDVLKGLIENLQPRIRHASTSIAGYSVIVKKIRVPFVDEREIEDNIAIEAENYVPFEIDEVYLDFYPLNNGNGDDQGTDLFLVAAKKEIVDDYAHLLQHIGLNPAVVDVDAFAMGNAFEGSYGVMSEAVALIDLGAQKANLNVISKGQSVFARDMAIGGNQITMAIQEATGMDFEEAEKIKISGTKDEALKSEVSRVIKDVCAEWVKEIKKALDYYKMNSKPEDAPRQLLLCGGSVLLPGLDKLFAQRLNLPVRLFNPFVNFESEKQIDQQYIDSIGPQMAIAAGLALRSVAK